MVGPPSSVNHPPWPLAALTTAPSVQPRRICVLCYRHRLPPPTCAATACMSPHASTGRPPAGLCRPRQRGAPAQPHMPGSRVAEAQAQGCDEEAKQFPPGLESPRQSLWSTCLRSNNHNKASCKQRACVRVRMRMQLWRCGKQVSFKPKKEPLLHNKNGSSSQQIFCLIIKD